MWQKQTRTLARRAGEVLASGRRSLATRMWSPFEGGVKPHRCVVQPWDYGHRIRFAVFDKDGRTDMPDIILNEVRDARNLEAVIELARDQSGAM